MSTAEHLRMKLLRERDALLEKRSQQYDELKKQTKRELIELYQQLGGIESYTLRANKADIIWAILDLQLPTEPIFARLEMLENSL